MTTRIRKITAAGISAGLLAGIGISGAQAATNTDSSTSGSSTSTARQAPKHRGGPSSAQLQRIASSLGVTTTQLKAAIDANRPAKPTGAKGDRGAGMAADLAAALGADATKVQAILEAGRPAKPTSRPAAGTRPAKPDHTKLTAALASGLSLDEATVTAALDKLEAARTAEHDARHQAEYAAIAKTLGVNADAVQTAFDAVRPAKPTT
jgi:hypothetical protein